ncbi:MAG: CidA/LrgA family protein [Candidatus Devosia phytovorans]|uniref:CidA/LrgA family protein n=1 Tax=Candidatus Devosia phytovorans TaxID=3121372 RepID=A0AAJ6AYA2_9HYPH|nr:CidA/LrgA family protein [Devosia sp.]WEK03350.1 MAG: CidA/LrgA family protein [Devosia sp.]
MTDTFAPPLKPNDLVAGFVVLILCQLAGEALVGLLRLAVPGLALPGPVLGMILLLVLLVLRRQEARAIMSVANGLLGVLSLLFVPSAVGIMQHAELIRTWGFQLLIAVIASTLLTLVVTVFAFLATERLLARTSP